MATTNKPEPVAASSPPSTLPPPPPPATTNANSPSPSPSQSMPMSKPERPCYIVLGKPGVGRTTVATNLAAAVNARLVSPEAVLKEIVDDEGRPEHPEIMQILSSGAEIPTKKIMQLLLNAVRDQDTLFRGYVLDGLPSGLLPTAPSSPDSASTDPTSDDITLLNSILTENQPYFTPYLIDLSLSDDDLIRRRAGQWCDTETGILYPGAQVVFSRKRRAEGHGDEEAHEDDDEEQQSHDDEDGEDEDAEEKEDEEESGSDAGSGSDASDDEEKKRKGKKKKKEVQVSLMNKVEWPLISMDILNRLVKRPEDSPEHVTHLLASYPTTALTHLLSTHFRNAAAHRIIPLDASQHPDILLPSLVARLDSLGVGLRVVPPKKIDAPDPAPANLADALRYFATAQLEDEEPARELGVWKNYDPVEAKDGKLVKVDSFDYCVCYKGKLYFQSTPATHTLFLSNPLPYLLTLPHTPPLSISILGGPTSGKTTLSKLLAQTYALTRVSLDDVLDTWDEDGGSATVYGDEFPEIRHMCQRGLDVPPDVAARLVKAIVRHVRDTRKESGDGWILDGFPRTAEQAQALRAVGLVPAHTVHLQNDASDDKIRTRALLPRFFDARSTAFHDSVTETIKLLTTPVEQQQQVASAGETSAAETGKEPPISATTLIHVDATLTPAAAMCAVQGVVDPFFDKAEALSHKQLAALPATIPFGATKDYCPVALHDYGVLIKGDNAHVAQYKGQYYYFSAPECLTAFISEPTTYAPVEDASSSSSNRIRIPPPRIVIVGCSGSGKTTLSNALCAATAAAAAAAAEPSSPMKITHLVWEDVVRAWKDRNDKRAEKSELDGEGEDELGEEDVVRVFRELVQGDPTNPTGFILENFPAPKSHMDALLSAHLHPDAVIHLVVESETAVTRIARVWRKAGKMTLRLRSSEDDAEDGADGEEPGEDLDPIVEAVERGMVHAADVVEAAAAAAIPVLHVDTNGPLRAVVAAVRRVVAPYLENRASLFSTAYPITKKEATRMLDLGTKSLSAFRKFCPVTLATTRYLTKASVGTLPVLSGDHIYYLKDKSTQKTFLSNPHHFLHLPPPPPVIRPHICILGGPKSGATTLARALAAQLDTVYLDLPLVLQTIVDGGEVALGLYDELKTVLDRGEAVSDELAARAVRCVTARAACVEKGWILDGWPMTHHQAQLLESLGVQPHEIFQLSIPTSEVLQRTAADKALDIANSTPSLNHAPLQLLRLHSYTTHITATQMFYTTTYGNWHSAPAYPSRWAAKHHTLARIHASIAHRQAYLGALLANTPAPIANVGTDMHHVATHMGRVGEYCPVRLTDHAELVVGTHGMTYMAEYKGAYYRLAGEQEFATFGADPERYVENGRPLPDPLPIRRSPSDIKSLFPAQLELRGYCPVTYALAATPTFAAIVPGLPHLLAEYDSKLYTFASEPHLHEFMKTPWRFAHLVLPHKLPPPTAPVTLTALPMIGYLEQTVATRITEALVEVGKARPKFPYKGLGESAVEYLALWLKAHNPHAKDWTRKAYLKRLDHFTDKCSLIGYLHTASGMNANTNTTTNTNTTHQHHHPSQPTSHNPLAPLSRTPPPPYITPDDRDPAFDRRMGEFVALRPLPGVQGAL
ncbi:hypothetical protein DFJ77DRAFT_476617 [Powellomyces hirtus]|nr:hypothetical protein DFJ77DRAFT_476617 [Powellomyces hirtus]